jgi:hypothetical protein
MWFYSFIKYLIYIVKIHIIINKHLFIDTYCNVYCKRFILTFILIIRILINNKCW